MSGRLYSSQLPLFFSALFLLRVCALPTAASQPWSPTTQNDENPSKLLNSYLQNPSDFTTILLIIGGDIVRKALAQLCGSSYGAPVAFSFGWVSYSFSALASIIGDGRLMPEPEFQSLVASSSSGYVRQNSSWILARLLRDLERKAPPGKGGLCVTVFHALGRGGEPKRDWVWFIGIFVIPTQFVIALIPWILRGNWAVFLLTASGTVLALSGSMMPQWAAEKWCCRRRKGCYSITRGNGHRHVFVIKNASQEGLNLEDLAASHVQLSPLAEICSQGFSALTSALWLMFLICAGALEADIWYLLGVGILGMMQNIIVAGATRSPQASGFNLRQQEVIEGPRVMEVLRTVEQRYDGVGLSLLSIFFPGDLRLEEENFWRQIKNERSMRGGAGIESKHIERPDSSLTLAQMPMIENCDLKEAHAPKSTRNK